MVFLKPFIPILTFHFSKRKKEKKTDRQTDLALSSNRSSVMLGNPWIKYIPHWRAMSWEIKTLPFVFPASYSDSQSQGSSCSQGQRPQHDFRTKQFHPVVLCHRQEGQCKDWTQVGSSGFKPQPSGWLWAAQQVTYSFSLRVLAEMELTPKSLWGLNELKHLQLPESRPTSSAPRLPAEIASCLSYRLWPFLPLAFLSHCPSACTSGIFESFSHSSLDNLVWPHSSWKEETKTELTNKVFSKNLAHLKNDGHLVPHIAPFLTATLNLPLLLCPWKCSFLCQKNLHSQALTPDPRTRRKSLVSPGELGLKPKW